MPATIKQSARFAIRPFSPDEMHRLGAGLADDIRARISQGLDVNDQPAKALKPGYAKRKTARGLQPIRDLVLTGRTMRALQVLSAEENRVVIGFSDPASERKAHQNNQRARQFGASPKDLEKSSAAVHDIKVTGVKEG